MQELMQSDGRGVRDLSALKYSTSGLVRNDQSSDGKTKKVVNS